MTGSLLLAMFLSTTICGAQDQTSTTLTYSIDGAVTLTPIVSLFQDPRYPGAQENLSLGFGTFVRAQWRPGRLLTFGVLTGWAVLAHDDLPVQNSTLAESPPASATLTTIPLQALVTMRSGSLEIGLGMGPYIMMSELQTEDISTGRRFELGITVLASYLVPISKNISIGPELRLVYMDYRGILSIMPSLTCSTSLHEY